MLNEACNSNDAMHVRNNVCLTAMGARFSMADMQPSCRKADLSETRDNDTITRKVHADGNELFPEKNGGYIYPVVQAVG